MPKVIKLDYTRWVDILNDSGGPIQDIDFHYTTTTGGRGRIRVASALAQGEVASLPLATSRLKVAAPYVSYVKNGTAHNLAAGAPGRSSNYLRYILLAVCKSGKIGGFGRFVKSVDASNNTVAMWPC